MSLTRAAGLGVGTRSVAVTVQDSDLVRVGPRTWESVCFFTLRVVTSLVTLVISQGAGNERESRVLVCDALIRRHAARTPTHNRERGWHRVVLNQVTRLRTVRGCCHCGDQCLEYGTQDCQGPTFAFTLYDRTFLGSKL